MTRFHGVVGYATGESVELPEGSGNWKDEFVERSYFGTVVSNSRTLLSGEKLNDDLSVGNSISIVADAYARDHFHNMKYVEWAGELWKVAEVTEKRPRLLLRLGGVYNGGRAERPVPSQDEAASSSDEPAGQ